MHTIPVSKHSLILSKTISSTCYLILSGIMIFALLFVGVYGLWFDSKIVRAFLDAIGNIDTIFLILLLLSLLVGVIFNQIMIYASIALGQKHNSKILYSIIYGIVIYNATQIISTILLLPFMLMDSNYQQYIEESNVLDFGLINGFIALSLVISILFIVAYYFLTVKTFDKKLNLE